MQVGSVDTRFCDRTRGKDNNNATIKTVRAQTESSIVKNCEASHNAVLNMDIVRC